MNIRNLALARAALILTFLWDFSYASEPMQGWRFPNEGDYKGDWLKYKDQINIPFRIEADFNGDDLDDSAWILFSNEKDEWGVFVFLSKSTGGQEIVELERNSFSLTPQKMGLSILSPGQYDSICGKGYWECSDNDIKEINLRLPAINLFTYESSSSIFYWDLKAKKFVEIWLGD